MQNRPRDSSLREINYDLNRVTFFNLTEKSTRKRMLVELPLLPGF